MGRKAVQPVAAIGAVTRVENKDKRWGFDPKYISTMKPERVATETMTGALPHVYYCIVGDSWQTEKLITRVKPMKISANLGPNGFEYDENTVFDFDSGRSVDENGVFDYGTQYSGPTANWWIRTCMMRDAPFTGDDVDIDKVIDHIHSQNINGPLEK